MTTTLRFMFGIACLLSLACCTNPGCLRHSQCGKGLECRDGACERPLLQDAAPSRDAGPAAQVPFADAGWEPLTGAASSGEADASAQTF